MEDNMPTNDNNIKRSKNKNFKNFTLEMHVKHYR